MRETLFNTAMLKSANWGTMFLKHLTGIDALDRVEFGREACEEILGEPAAIAKPEWATIVAVIIDATPLFEDIAEDVYGERVSFEDDEGPLCQGWDEYSALNEVAELLASPQTYKHLHWKTLCLKLIEKSGEPGNSIELEELLLAPTIDEGGDWAALIPAYLKVDAYDFIGNMFEHDAVLEHEDFLKWVTPYKSYVMMAAAVLQAKEHGVFEQLVALVKDEPNIRSQSEFAEIKEAALEKFGLAL